jgi:hypothetical protein
MDMDEKDFHYIYTNMVEKYGTIFISNFPKIANHISDFINKSSDVLQTKNVGKHLYYTKAIENDFFDCLGIDRNDVISIVSSSPSIPYSYNDEKEPIYNILLILSSFYEVHEKEMEKLYGKRVVPAHFIRMYLGLRIYSICQRQIFKYDTKDDVMEYTVANLNNKFIITKVENVYQFVEHYVVTNNSSLNIDFKNIRDPDIYAWNSKLIHRIKNSLKEIFRVWKKNYDDKKSIVTEQIVLQGDEGKTYLTIPSSVSNTIDIHTKKILQCFIQDNVRRNLVVIACKKCGGISVEKTIILINSIRNSKDNELLVGIIKDILSYWIISLKQTVQGMHSTAFIKKLTAAYSISNTYDIFISDLKNRLNDVILKYGSDYIDTEKRSTLNSFKQAVYLYLVFYISSIE